MPLMFPTETNSRLQAGREKREKNLPSSPGNAKQDPAEPNPLFSQPWASIYRTAKVRPTLTSKVVATRVNLHGSCSAQAVIVTFLLAVPIPDGCPLSAKARTAHAHKVPRHSQHGGGMKIHSKKSKLKNSQRGIFSENTWGGVWPLDSLQLLGCSSMVSPGAHTPYQLCYPGHPSSVSTELQVSPRY